MKRRVFVSALLSTAIWPLAGGAQPQPGKVYRLGILAATGTLSSPFHQAFLGQLESLGYVEGRNVVIEFRSVDGRADRFPELAEELLRTEPDLILAPLTAAAIAVQRLSRSVPIVFAFAADPVVAGLAASLARPGGNATGLSVVNTELAGKRVELLKEVIPTLTRAAVLRASPVNPPTPTGAAIMRETEAGARILGIALDLIEITDATEIEQAFATIASRGHQALIVLPTTISLRHFARIAGLALNARLAAVGDGRHFVEAGGLLTYGSSYPDQMRRAAIYVDKILRGAKPADLPVEQPTRFDLAINLKTAAALGLTIPPALFARANEVIE